MNASLALEHPVFRDMPQPTQNDLQDPLFNAIWNATKDWDVGVPAKYDGHTGMLGSHVMIIVNAVRATRPQEAVTLGSHFQRMDPQPLMVTQRHVYLVDGTILPVPADMPGAEPWRDRDGEWFWRRTIGGSQS